MNRVLKRDFFGRIGTGTCQGCGNQIESGLGLWEERLRIVGLYSKRLPLVRRYFLCIPCSDAEYHRPLAPFIGIRSAS